MTCNVQKGARRDSLAQAAPCMYKNHTADTGRVAEKARRLERCSEAKSCGVQDPAWPWPRGASSTEVSKQEDTTGPASEAGAFYTRLLRQLEEKLQPSEAFAAKIWHMFVSTRTAA